MKSRARKPSYGWHAGRSVSKLLLLSCSVIAFLCTLMMHSDVSSEILNSAPTQAQTRQLAEGDATVWQLRPGQVEGGYRRHGAAAYYYVLIVQILVAALGTFKAIKENGESDGCFIKTVCGWDFISTCCAFVSLILLGEIAKANFIGDPLFIWDAAGQSMSVIATSSEAAAGASCYKFDVAAMKAECAQDWADFEDCKHRSEPRCLENYVHPACQMMGKDEPVVGFANNLQGWFPVVLFAVGNTVRLLVTFYDLVVRKEEADPVITWLVGAIQDGFAYVVGMFVTQLSVEDDCLQIQYLTNIREFATVYYFVFSLAVMNATVIVSLLLSACLRAKDCSRGAGGCIFVCCFNPALWCLASLGCFLAFGYSWIILFKDIIEEPSLQNILAFVFAWIGFIGGCMGDCGPYSLCCDVDDTTDQSSDEGE